MAIGNDSVETEEKGLRAHVRRNYGLCFSVERMHLFGRAESVEIERLITHTLSESRSNDVIWPADVTLYH